MREWRRVRAGKMKIKATVTAVAFLMGEKQCY